MLITDLKTSSNTSAETQAIMPPVRHTRQSREERNVPGALRSTTSQEDFSTRKPYKKPKAQAVEPELEKPLSQMDLTEPIKDMNAFVNRSVDERLKRHVDKARPPRPLNAFFLYRTAYAEQAKEFQKSGNHQTVSKITAKSWKLETSEVRDYFKGMAEIERINHGIAFPDYEYQPVLARHQKERKSKFARDETPEDDEDVLEEQPFGPDMGSEGFQNRQYIDPASVPGSYQNPVDLDTYHVANDALPYYPSSTTYSYPQAPSYPQVPRGNSMDPYQNGNTTYAYPEPPGSKMLSPPVNEYHHTQSPELTRPSSSLHRPGSSVGRYQQLPESQSQHRPVQYRYYSSLDPRFVTPQAQPQYMQDDYQGNSGQQHHAQQTQVHTGLVAATHSMPPADTMPSTYARLLQRRAQLQLEDIEELYGPLAFP